MKLNPKQIKFCEEYSEHFNKKRAYIKAGYEVASIQSAVNAANKFLKIPEIQVKIDDLLKDKRERVRIKEDDVLNKLWEIANANVGDYLDWQNKEIDDEGNLSQLIVKIKDKNILSADEKYLIASIEPGPHGHKIKLLDKVKALELIGRHLGMFQDNINHTGEMTFSQMVKNVSQKS